MSELALRPLAGNVNAMVGRCLRLSLRNVDGLITALALPIMLMLMFVYLFGGALDTGVRYVDYVVPGVLAVCIGFGTAGVAVSVSHDLGTGVIDRFRSMNTSGGALIAGQVAASVARNLISTVLLFAVAFVIGFRSNANPLRWLAVVGVLVLFIVALSWLAAAIGVAVRSPEAASGATFLVSFLAYPSSAFVPIHTMPSWLQAFARNQPINAVVDAVRALLAGAPAGAAVWRAVAWCSALSLASFGLATVLFARRVR